MENLNPPEKCPKCGGQISERKGISRKNNKPFHFWGCSAYPSCDYTWRPAPKRDNQHKETLSALREVYKEVISLRKDFQDFVKIFGEKDK